MNRDDIDFELRDIDEDILDLLEDGRQTRQNLAALLDVTGEYVYQRIDLLIKLGVVEKIHDGFYELEQNEAVGQGEDESDTPMDTPPASQEPEKIDNAVDEPEAYADVQLPKSLEKEIERYRDELERTNKPDIDSRVAAAKAVGRMLVAENGVSRSKAQNQLLPQYSISALDAKSWWKKAGKERFAKVDDIEWNKSMQRFEIVT